MIATVDIHYFIELRTKYSPGLAKSSRKLFEQSQKVEKSYPQIFTREIELQLNTDWFTQVLRRIGDYPSQIVAQK